MPGKAQKIEKMVKTTQKGSKCKNRLFRVPLTVKTWFTPHLYHNAHFSNSVSYIINVSDAWKG